MKLDVDSKQRITTAFYMLLEFYKIIMGTFLVVFVPQQCGDQLCTATENFMATESLRVGANACNFVTFASIGTLYFIELKRENWCIKYLDIDEEKSNTNLDDEIEMYPAFKKQMNKLNNQYIKAVYVSLFLMIVNFVVSGSIYCISKLCWFKYFNNICFLFYACIYEIVFCLQCWNNICKR